MIRNAFPLAALSIFGLAACASENKIAQPIASPQPIRIPHGGLAGTPHMRALDLQGGYEEQPAYEVAALGDLATSSAAVAIGPNEAIDLDMEAEHAAEEDLLDELESSGPKKIASVLAVTTGTVTWDIPLRED